jgi:hypothetical protein
MRSIGGLVPFFMDPTKWVSGMKLQFNEPVNAPNFRFGIRSTSFRSGQTHLKSVRL